MRRLTPNNDDSKGNAEPVQENGQLEGQAPRKGKCFHWNSLSLSKKRMDHLINQLVKETREEPETNQAEKLENGEATEKTS